MADVFEKARKFPSDGVKAKGITQTTMEFVALDNQPFSVVEDVGFRRLIEHIEPRYVMPSRRHFSEVCLPELFNVAATHVHEHIAADISAISFTTDIWSSDVSITSMLSLTHNGSTLISSCTRFCSIHKSFEGHIQQQPFLMHSPICSTHLKCMSLSVAMQEI